MPEPTLALVAAKLDEVVAGVHEIRTWLVGNGSPGIFGEIRDLRRESATHDHAALRDKNGTSGWWRRLAFDVARNVATMVIMALSGWLVATFLLGLRVSLGSP